MSQAHTEILNQPQSWRATLTLVPDIWAGIAEGVGMDDVAHILLMGSGTSLYIAQAAAHTMMELTGIPSTAVPPSEVFLSPASTVPRQGKVLAFIISRSGTTSEALLAAAYLREHSPHVVTVGVTCNPDTPLEDRCDHSIALPHATEKAVVMTQSFTTMLLALQVVAALVGDQPDVLAELATLPDAFDAGLANADDLARRLAADKSWDTAIFLGLGAYRGLAEEGTLKLKEMTQTVCEAYNPLEFRHGPISIVDEETLIVLMEGQREAAYLADIQADTKRYGARVVAIGPHTDDGPDERLVVGQQVSDLARAVLYVPVVQLLAFHRAIALGIDPDQPRNLGQVVVLNVP